MLHWKTFIKHWRDKELQGLTIVEAVKKILEMEGENGDKRK
jgi:hypothetical protein|nr:MAG TPA: hypothetical protein [Caudoviricetes sp.]